MQRIYGVNRKRRVSAVCFAGLMGAMAVAPGPAFAQAVKNAAELSSGKTDSKAASDSASPEKLIVGTWRGGTNSGKITFKADGTYREFPTSLSQGNDPNLPVQQNAQGAWSFDQGELVLSWYADQVVQFANGEAQPAKVELHGRFKIGRLDGSFLRLVGAADPNNPRAPVIFYRRLGDITPLDSLKDKVSPEVLRVAELAHMDSEEALLLAAWSKTDPRRSPWLALAVSRPSAANGKLALKELFGFSDAELNAFNKLKDLVGQRCCGRKDSNRKACSMPTRKVPRKKSLLFKINGRSSTTPLVLRWGHYQAGGVVGAGTAVAASSTRLPPPRLQISVARRRSPARLPMARTPMIRRSAAAVGNVQQTQKPARAVQYMAIDRRTYKSLHRRPAGRRRSSVVPGANKDLTGQRRSARRWPHRTEQVLVIFETVALSVATDYIGVMDRFSFSLCSASPLARRVEMSADDGAGDSHCRLRKVAVAAVAVVSNRTGERGYLHAAHAGCPRAASQGQRLQTAAGRFDGVEFAPRRNLAAFLQWGYLPGAGRCRVLLWRFVGFETGTGANWFGWNARADQRAAAHRRCRRPNVTTTTTTRPEPFR